MKRERRRHRGLDTPPVQGYFFEVSGGGAGAVFHGDDDSRVLRMCVCVCCWPRVHAAK